MFAPILIFASVLAGGLAALLVPWWHAIWGVGALVLFAANHIYWQNNVRARPRLAVWLSLLSYGFVFLSSAAAVYGGVVFANVVPTIVAQLASDAGAQNLDAVTKILTGAVATLIGALWLDNAKSVEGSHWPPGAYKRALGAAYAGSDMFNVGLGEQRTVAMERLYSIIYDDVVYDRSIRGWDFAACRARANGVRSFDPQRP